GGWDRSVRLWDPATGKEQQPAAGHRGTVKAVAFAPDGRSVASGGRDCTVRFWDWVTGRELCRCDNVGEPLLGGQWGVIDVSYAPDGKTLVSAERHPAKTVFRVWDVKTGKPLLAFDGDHVSAIACAPDHETLLTANWDGHISVWELTRGKWLRHVGKKLKQQEALAVSPDGRKVAWVGQYGDFGVRDLKTGKDLFQISNQVAAAKRVAFSPDGTVVAT